MKFELPYGYKKVSLDIPDTYQVDIISPQYIAAPDDQIGLVLHAIDQYFIKHPDDIFSGDKKVAVAINDKTRPVPHDLILPALLERIEAKGVNRNNIVLIIAVGTHDPMLPDEYIKILPKQIIESYKVISHNCDDQNNLIFLGHTSRKTPVFVNRLFYDADIKIVTGNIEPHHFQGYSGGSKSASIGLGGRQTVNQNHSMLVDPFSKMGEYTNNPCRQDVEEIGEMIGVDFALNVVLNPERKIVSAVFGTPRIVMEEGILLAQEVYETSVSKKYDVVVASVGGAPKDINLYQAQKALAHSAQIVRQGGVIIILAECQEGVGSHSYEAFMQGVNSYEQVFEKLKNEGFRVGPHKALLIARDAMKAKVILISQMDPETVKKYLLFPSESAQTAFEEAVKYIGFSEDIKIAVMPKAASTIPSYVKNIGKS